ncbi:hypothetical protein M0802_015193 [Mischocyttarus mexicanus]|nr:hypothetical protein M0802_015193 [Mischocyttarus mexicanus]
MGLQKFDDFDQAQACLIYVDNSLKEESLKFPSNTLESRKIVANIRPKFGKRGDGGGEGCPSLPDSNREAQKSSSRCGSIAIRHLKYNPRWESPCFAGTSPQLTGQATFMIDTGAEVNLLKMNAIRPSTLSEKTNILYLTGITTDKQKTLGKGYYKVSNTALEEFWFKVPRLKLIEFKENTLPHSGSYANIPASEI